MKKTININLNNTIFSIEEDAYQLLDEYLNDVKKYFASHDDHTEIVADIEARIAEQCMQDNGRPLIINMQHVETMIASMGRPGEFEDEIAPESANKNTESRRLYRDADRTIAGGVASGIAAYFSIDPIWIRLLFVLMTLTGGYGMLVYIVFWLTVPVAKTSAEKLAMNGQSITLESIKNSFTEDGIAQKGVSHFQKFITGLESSTRPIMKTFLTITAMIIGIGLIITAASGLVALLFAAGIALPFHSNQIEGLQFLQLFNTGQYYLIIACAFFAATIPLIFTGLLGISLVRMRNTFNIYISSVLIVVWILAGGILAGMAITHGERIGTYVDQQDDMREALDIHLE